MQGIWNMTVWKVLSIHNPGWCMGSHIVLGENITKMFEKKWYAWNKNLLPYSNLKVAFDYRSKNICCGVHLQDWRCRSQRGMQTLTKLSCSVKDIKGAKKWNLPRILKEQKIRNWSESCIALGAGGSQKWIIFGVVIGNPTSQLMGGCRRPS